MMQSRMDHVCAAFKNTFYVQKNNHHHFFVTNSMQFPDDKIVSKLPGQIFQDDNNTNNNYLVVYVKYFLLT